MFAPSDVVKILLVSHNFPPASAAGTEIYTAELATALLERGHGVEVFTSAKDISLPDLSLRERSYCGVRVHELINNLYYRDFRETWDHPGIERVFAELLGRLQVDLVHFQHLMYLSAGCVEVAHDRGLPVIFTLHDYWLQCPRFGQRVHADGGLCDTILFSRCGTCLARFKFGQSSIEKRVGEVVAGVRAGTGINLARLVRTAADALQKSTPPEKRSSDRPADAMAIAAEQRTARLRQHIVPKVDLFLSPSRFLRERYIREWGIAPEQIEHLRFGVDQDASESHARTLSARVQVAFIGSLIPIKGPQVLLDAWGRLPESLRSTCDLALFGPSRHEPEFQRMLARKARSVGARLGGRLERQEVAALLREIDLLVVPSLWYENSPLIILEALAARTPMLVSDLGGMAELVREGVNGLHFRMGDVLDLALHLEQLLGDRERLQQLSQRTFDLPQFGQHVLELEMRYRSVLSAHSLGSRT